MIDGPGNYRTRDGHDVVIQDIGDPARSTFNCKGHWIKVDALGRRYPQWTIWKPNGQFAIIGEHRKDVVAKVAQ